MEEISYTHQQRFVLMLVFCDFNTINKINQTLYKSRSRIHQIVKKLERGGFVDIDRSKNGEIIIKNTEKGNRIVHTEGPLKVGGYVMGPDCSFTHK